MIHRVFVDANILIAGAASRTGASRAILMLAEIGLIQLVVSRQVLDEAERNLRKKLPSSLPIFAQLLAILPIEVVPDPPLDASAKWTTIIEVKDAPVLEAAVACGAERLISLNTKDFTPEVGELANILVQTPGQFIKAVRSVMQGGLAT